MSERREQSKTVTKGIRRPSRPSPQIAPPKLGRSGAALRGSLHFEHPPHLEARDMTRYMLDSSQQIYVYVADGNGVRISIRLTPEEADRLRGQLTEALNRD